MLNSSPRALSKVLIAASWLLATQAISAPAQFRMVVEGVKQGKFKGDSATGKNAGTIDVVGFSFAETVPLDAASGLATGRRQHQPITVVKEWDAASPQFLQALVTNEVLSSVALSLTSAPANGVPSSTFQITLTNAHVVSVLQTVSQVGGVTTNTETIQLVYEKILEEDSTAGISATDDWSTPN